jgi:surface protein
MKIKLTKMQLRKLIIDGITTEELHQKYDYSDITNMGYMFHNCSKLKTIPLLDTSKVTMMSYMFGNCESLETVPLLDTSKVTMMNGMFKGCTIIKSIPLFDTSKVMDMDFMFYRCYELKSCHNLNIPNLYKRMFAGCKKLEINPHIFPIYDWEDTENEFLKEKYPELFI